MHPVNSLVSPFSQNTSIDVSLLIDEAYSRFGKLSNSTIERLRLKRRLTVTTAGAGWR